MIKDKDYILQLIQTPFFWCNLSPQMAKVIYWFLRGKNYSEIAEKIGTSKTMVGKYFHKALERINKADEVELKPDDLMEHWVDILDEALKQ
jgi:transcriptional regulator